MLIPGLGAGATPVDDGDAYSTQKGIIVLGMDGSGNLQILKTDTDGTVAVDVENTIKTTPENFWLEAVRGNLSDFSSVKVKYGRNDNIDTNTDPEDVWHGGGLYTGQPYEATPETIELFSSDDEDGDAGATGMLTCTIEGLRTSSSTAYTQETGITLNGQNGVDSADTWYRVNRVIGETYGSVGSNVGTITARHKTTTANIFAVLPAGAGQTQICAWTVPAGETAYMWARLGIIRASGAAGSARGSFRVREPGMNGYNAKRLLDLNTGGNTLPWIAPETIPASSDVVLRIDEVSDSNTIINGEIAILTVTD